MSKLFTYGRGHYSEAVGFLAEHSSGSPVTIGGDHDFRIGMVLRFYCPAVIGRNNYKYYPQDSLQQHSPEWLICHKESFEDPAPPGDYVKNSVGTKYDLIKTFPTAPLSGMHWYLCHKLTK